MTSFDRLEAWNRCHELTLAIYGTTIAWPKHELYGLVGQVRRAAVSAEANIAEGSAKRGSREFRRYLDIAVGSLAELTCLLRLARDLHYVDAEDDERLEQLREHAARTTWGLLSAITRRGRLSP